MLMIKRTDIDHAMKLAPEMAWLLAPELIRFALQSPRLNARAVKILEQRAKDL